MVTRALMIAVALIAGSASVGCSHLGYYWQSARGQLALLNAREPIDELLDAAETDPALRHKLTVARDAVAFAEAELNLQSNGAYQDYADLQRPHVVWNVVATPALSLEPKQWCFLVVGCVAYRGYFNEADAQTLADELRAEGYDVAVGGVSAYSTLGWFNDPILNTMLHWPDDQLAATIFHELAHQVIYIPDDTVFNEAFATTVETAGLARWFSIENNTEQATASETRRARHAAFVNLLLGARERLATIYANDGPDDEKRTAKRAAFQQLRDDYLVFKQRWHGFSGYDVWFNTDLNNAKLTAISTYHELTPAFTQMLHEADGDFASFYAEVQRLGDLSTEERAAELASRMSE